MIGGIAEHYAGVIAVVIGVSEHQAGLAHLNQYWLWLSAGVEERFYEFQITSAGQDCTSEEHAIDEKATIQHR